MTGNLIDIREFHWMMDMLETIEVGLVVLDNEYRIQVWNSFMENHSGITSSRVKDRNLFESFPDLPADWLKKKIENAKLLRTRGFTSWEQRPYIFKFKNYRPITGTEDFMYQNSTLSPLASADGKVNHVCLIIYDVTDVASNRRALEKVNIKLEKLSQTDRLTGLLNRGTWESILASEFHRYDRYQHPSSLIMFDIDHFKKVNDTYGHPAGDEVIRETARILIHNLRQSDIAGRYGGEEFGVILPETDVKGAAIFAERVRKNIEDLTVTAGEHQIRFTISLGIAPLDEGIMTYNEWLERSDKALYASKKGGRNQFNVYSPEMTAGEH